MDPALDRGILRRQTESIKPHREQDVVALHTLEAGPHITGRHSIPVADVNVTAGIRKHRQGIELGLVGIDDGLVELIALPGLLPLRFDLLRLIGFRHDVSSLNNLRYPRYCTPGDGNYQIMLSI